MPMQRDLYPRNWPKIARKLKEAADWTCQLCGAKRGEKQRNRHGELVDVQIGVMHPNHDPWNRNADLVVACRQCHIRHDARDGRRKRAMMQIARGQMVLPGMNAFYASPRRSRKAEQPARRVTRVRKPRERERRQVMQA